MIEVSTVRQIPGEPRRRWFSSSDFDLIVRYEANGALAGFELCYDKPQRERAIIYSPSAGFRHMMVDDGEQRPGKYKASPVLTADGAFDAPRVLKAFLAAGAALPDDVLTFVRQALERHASFQGD